MASGTVLRLEVHRPIKTPDRYEFRCDVSGAPFTTATAIYRLKSIARGFGSPARTTLRFGFRATNFTIAHAEVWDSVFPLMYLTRNGGPLFKTAYDAATIRFRYPVLESVRRFFVQRAANSGLSVTVEADTIDRTYDIPGKGNILAFGGGKESRLLLGLLRELGQTPRLTTGGAENAPPDLPSAEISEPFWGALAERVMPALMSGAGHVYFGGALGEVPLNRPWQQYYDMASPEGQHELSTLCGSLGVDLTLHGPLSVLPSNLVQKVLSARYPDLAAHQQSVLPGRPTEKNLHLSLLKIHHGLAISPHCADVLFRRLLRAFVTDKLSHPDDFGFHNFRELFHREMMAIAARRRDHPLLDEVRSRVPAEWEASWIDGIHTYIDPRIDPSVLEVFRQYANDYVPGPGEFRVPTPKPRDGGTVAGATT